jgi:hypothetical protein
LRSRELSLADAESQLAAKDEALAAAGQETANMHKVRQRLWWAGADVWARSQLDIMQRGRNIADVNG